ncbi:MAG: SDR family NAD(P)-dependent oxidoreductase [Acidobacteriota bacterium]
MDLGLTNKAALITGSSRGLGFASARALVQEGCRVCLCARGEEQLLKAGAELASVAGAADRVTVVRADLSTPKGAEDVVAHAVAVLGGLDIVINNVGRAAGADIVSTSDQDWQAAFDETLFPAIRVSRLAVPHLRRRGGGAIIMIASIYGREAGGRMTYNAVKAAEISLSKAMAQQLAKDNIRVNAVAPGSILFEGGSWWKRQQENPEAIAEMIARELPFGRFGRPEEVGTVVAFLASARASWISGACITVDGCQGRSNI